MKEAKERQSSIHFFLVYLRAVKKSVAGKLTSIFFLRLVNNKVPIEGMLFFKQPT